jgi:hypothetical protein
MSLANLQSNAPKGTKEISSKGLLVMWLSSNNWMGTSNGTNKSSSPPPWSVEEQSVCYVVRDNKRKRLAHAYFEEEPGRRSAA